jgi:hypothetical protein
VQNKLRRDRDIGGSTPVEVFCSYAHEDEVWLRELEIHLSQLKRQGLISL